MPRRRPSKSPSKAAAKTRSQAHLLGLALDNDDGHKRITQAEEFTILGGSEETHGRMAETVIKTFEELKYRGKNLRAVEPQELAEILHKSTPR